MADELDLDAIETRANQATDGPWVAYDLASATYDSTDNTGWWWVWRQDALPYYGGVMEPAGEFDIRGDDGRTYKVAGAIGGPKITDNDRGLVEKADAEFIAHARADVPALVAEVRRLRDENERLTGGLYPLAKWTPRSALALADDIGASKDSLLGEWIRAIAERDALRATIERVRGEIHHAQDNGFLITEGQGIFLEKVPGVPITYLHAALDGEHT